MPHWGHMAPAGPSRRLHDAPRRSRCRSACVVLAALACTLVCAPADAQQLPAPQAGDTLTIKLASVQWTSTCGPQDGFQATTSAPVWCANSCANLLPGLRLAMQKLQGIRTTVRDITGRTYNLNFTLILKDSLCNLTHYGLMMQQLTQRERPHFYIQGLARTAEVDDAITGAAGRILVHSMTLSDSAVATKPNTAFSIMPGTTRSLYTLVKAMANNGIRNFALGIAAGGLLASSYCGTLPAYVDSIQPFAPGFAVSRVFSYNNTDTATANITAVEEMVHQEAAHGTEALIFCTSGSTDAANVQGAIRRSGAYFKAVYIQHLDTDALDLIQNATASHRSAEGYLSYSLWDTGVPYFDEVLGHASTYAADFTRAFNRVPVFYSAFASASVVVIRNAVRLALQMCNLSNAAADMEAFMFNASYSVCRDPITGLRTSLSVYQLIYNHLATSYIETVAGPVGFNSQGVNDQLPTLTMQVQSGKLKVAYPIEVSNAPLIMPLPAPPPPPLPPLPPQPQVTIVYSDQSWASSGAGIAVIVSLCVGVPLLVAALALTWYLHAGRGRNSRTFKDLVTIPSDQLLVRCPPQQGQAGTGTYKHSLAVDLLCMVDNRQLVDTDASQASRRLAMPLMLGRERSVSWLLSRLGGGTPNNSMTSAAAAGSSKAQGRSRLALSLAPADCSGRASPAEEGAGTPRVLQLAGTADQAEAAPATRRGTPGKSRSHANLFAALERVAVAHASHPGVGPASNASDQGGRSGTPSATGVAVPMGAGSGSGAGLRAGLAPAAGTRTPPPPLTDKQLERMAEHVWTYMKIPHERLVPIHGIMWSEPVSPLGPLLVSERPELGTLASVLANDMLELEVHTRAYICLQVAEALDFMHSQDVFLRSPVMPAVHLAQGLRAKVSLTHLAQAWAAPSTHQDSSKSIPRALPGNQAAPQPTQRGWGEAFVPAGSAGGVFVQAQGLAADLQSRREDVSAFGAFVCQVFRHMKSQSGTLTSLDSVVLEEGMQDELDCVPELLRPLISQCLAIKPVANSGPSSGRLPLSTSRAPDSCDVRQPSMKGENQQANVSTSASPDPNSVRAARDAAKSGVAGAGADGRLDGDTPMTSAGLPTPELCMADVVASLQELIGELVEVAAQGGQASSSPAQLANMVKNTQRSENMLSEFFPPKVARQLQLGLPVQPEPYEEVAIFFSDICGYTQLCSQLNAAEVMDLLHRLYTSLDAITRELRLFKVETIGDAYMAVSNIKVPDPDAHARAMAIFAFSAVEAANSTAVHPQRPELGTVNIRVGLHSGPVVASIVGTLNRRYCLFGDAVNVAARMESSSERNMVHCSRDFAKLIVRQWPHVVAESRGLREIKGKGQLETFFLKPPRGFRTVRGTSSGGQAGPAGMSGMPGKAGQVGQTGMAGHVGQVGQIGQTGQVGQVVQVGHTGMAGQAGQVGRVGQLPQATARGPVAEAAETAERLVARAGTPETAALELDLCQEVTAEFDVESALRSWEGGVKKF